MERNVTHSDNIPNSLWGKKIYDARAPSTYQPLPGFEPPAGLANVLPVSTFKHAGVFLGTFRKKKSFNCQDFKGFPMI